MPILLKLSDPGMNPKTVEYQTSAQAFRALARGSFRNYTSAYLVVDGQPLHAAEREVGSTHWRVKTFTPENLQKGFGAAHVRWASAIKNGLTDAQEGRPVRQLAGAMAEYQADYDAAYREAR